MTLGPTRQPDLEVAVFDDRIGRKVLQLGSSTLYEAGQAAGACTVLDPRIRPMWPGASLCGPAYPIRCGTRDNLAVHRSLEHCGPLDVLLVAGSGDLVGFWGEILTAAAQARGVAGLVIDGGVRDLDALEQRNFPVFARGTGIPGATKLDPGEIGVPLQVGGVRVDPGDIIVADADGVVVISATRLTEVLAAAEKRAEAEAVFLDRISQGQSTMDILGLRERTAD